MIEEKTKRLENIANRLSKYLSPQVYKSIFDEEESGKKTKESYVRKNLTIFFSDIVNFTDLSDTLEAEKLALRKRAACFRAGSFFPMIPSKFPLKSLKKVSPLCFSPDFLS